MAWRGWRVRRAFLSDCRQRKWMDFGTPSLVRSAQFPRLRLPRRPRCGAPLRVGPRNDVRAGGTCEAGAVWVRAGEAMMQNKANLRSEQSVLTVAGKRSYEGKAPVWGRRKQSQFAPVRSVPVRASSRGATPQGRGPGAHIAHPRSRVPLQENALRRHYQQGAARKTKPIWTRMDGR